MKDEIKEILECLSLIARNEYVPDELLNDEMCQQLLDYITNLQEELQEYKMIFDTFSKRPYAHRYLEEKKIPEKLDDFRFKKEIDDLTDEECKVENYLSDVTDKINEIIDYLDYLKSKGE